jgi:ribosomal protein S12
MLLKNLDSDIGLINGARGTVIGFEKVVDRSSRYPMLPVVKFHIVMGGEESYETKTLKEESWEVKMGDR